MHVGCRTDLHIVDGELTNPQLPLIPGHEIVGTIVQVGEHVKNFQLGEKVGVPWLGFTDGTCAYCRSGRENLCENALFTGYTIDGGYAEYTVADYRYCFRIPEGYNPRSEAAPLMCAGLIGYRSYRMATCGNRGRTPRHLRFWSICPYNHSDRSVHEEEGLRFHSARRYRGSRICTQAWSNLGWRLYKSAA